MWKIIHEILHKKTSHSKEEIHLKGSHGKLIDDPFAVAEEFNIFSSMVGTGMGSIAKAFFQT